MALHFSISFVDLYVLLFDASRCNLEEVLFDSSDNLYRNSICCPVWSYLDYEFSVRNFYRLHLYAPGKLTSKSHW